MGVKGADAYGTYPAVSSIWRWRWGELRATGMFSSEETISFPSCRAEAGSLLVRGILQPWAGQDQVCRTARPTSLFGHVS